MVDHVLLNGTTVFDGCQGPWSTMVRDHGGQGPWSTIFSLTIHLV